MYKRQHEEIEKQGHADGHQSQQTAPFPIAVGQTAGDTADEDKQAGEKGFRWIEKLKQPGPPRIFEQIADHVKGVEKHH